MTWIHLLNEHVLKKNYSNLFLCFLEAYSQKHPVDTDIIMKEKSLILNKIKKVSSLMWFFLIIISYYGNNN